MEAKKVSRETENLQRRFFDAIDLLSSNTSDLRGLQTFCDKYGLHRAKYSNLRTGTRNPNRDSRYKFIDIDAIIYLVRDYNISAEWLLTGKGRKLKATRALQKANQ